MLYLGRNWYGTVSSLGRHRLCEATQDLKISCEPISTRLTAALFILVLLRSATSGPRVGASFVFVQFACVIVVVLLSEVVRKGAKKV